MTDPTPEAVAAIVAQGPPDARTDLPEGDVTLEPQNGTQGLIEARDRYRGERDTATAERDALAARLAGYQRAEVERLAGEKLAHPSDVFTLSGNEVAEYLDDNGNVDPEKVAADVAAILTERPLLRKPGGVDPTQGHGGGDPRVQPSFANLLRTVADQPRRPLARAR